MVKARSRKWLSKEVAGARGFRRSRNVIGDNARCVRWAHGEDRLYNGAHLASPCLFVFVCQTPIWEDSVYGFGLPNQLTDTPRLAILTVCTDGYKEVHIFKACVVIEHLTCYNMKALFWHLLLLFADTL
jgi:hypothetical protein